MPLLPLPLLQLHPSHVAPVLLLVLVLLPRPLCTHVALTLACLVWAVAATVVAAPASAVALVLLLVQLLVYVRMHMPSLLPACVRPVLSFCLWNFIVKV